MSHLRHSTPNDNHPPWWLWPNVLSLDAPLIAISWQALFARAGGCALAWPERASLFLAVWAIYAADRLLDARRLGVRASTAARHRFGHQHARALAAGIAAALGAQVILAGWFLSTRVTAAGAALGLLVGVYFVWNQLSGHRFGRGWLKEAVVSIVFAAGAALVPLASAPSRDLAADAAAFAVICMANCLLIARLDRERDRDRGEISIAARFPAGARPARTLAAAFSAGMLLWLALGGVTPTRLALLGSGLLIAGAVLVERRFGQEAACVWADAALLTPLAVLLVCR